ncbi:hypothetical protein [Aliivibrio fischeri]|uniref:hypothetical protein n=1 Tax=Aliivibrio fischeri TaxID=668 RepID=UPI00036FE575|nr:hypothetical protein [Aliivibrio fischeri]OEE12053.1 hypothetical protein A1Q3_18455 [Aliivibrio fischeri ZF-211]
MGDYADYGQTCPDGDVKEGNAINNLVGSYDITYKGNIYETLCIYNSFKGAIEGAKNEMDFIERPYHIIKDDNNAIFAVIPSEDIIK